MFIVFILYISTSAFNFNTANSLANYLQQQYLPSKNYIFNHQNQLHSLLVKYFSTAASIKQFFQSNVYSIVKLAEVCCTQADDSLTSTITSLNLVTKYFNLGTYPYDVKAIQFFANKQSQVINLIIDYKASYQQRPFTDFMNTKSSQLITLLNQFNTNVRSSFLPTITSAVFTSLITTINNYDRKSVNFVIDVYDRYQITNRVTNYLIFNAQSNIRASVQLLMTTSADILNFVTSRFNTIFTDATQPRNNNTTPSKDSIANFLLRAYTNSGNFLTFLQVLSNKKTQIFSFLDSLPSGSTFGSIQRNKRNELFPLINSILSQAGFSTLTQDQFNQRITLIQKYYLSNQLNYLINLYTIKPLYINYAMANYQYLNSQIDLLLLNNDPLVYFDQYTYQLYLKFRNCCGSNITRPNIAQLIAFLDGSTLRTQQFIDIYYQLDSSSATINSLVNNYYSAVSFQTFLSSNKLTIRPILSRLMVIAGSAQITISIMNQLVNIFNGYDDSAIGRVLDMRIERNLDDHLVNYICLSINNQIATILNNYKTLSVSNFLNNNMRTIYDLTVSRKARLNYTVFTLGTLVRRLRALYLQTNDLKILGSTLSQNYIDLIDLLQGADSMIQFYTPVQTAVDTVLMRVLNSLNANFNKNLMNQLDYNNAKSIVSSFLLNIPKFDVIKVQQFIQDYALQRKYVGYLLRKTSDILALAIFYKSTPNFADFFQRRYLELFNLVNDCCSDSDASFTRTSIWSSFLNLNSYSEVFEFLKELNIRGSVLVQLKNTFYTSDSLYSLLINQKSKIFPMLLNIQTKNKRTFTSTVYDQAVIFQKIFFKLDLSSSVPLQFINTLILSLDKFNQISISYFNNRFSLAQLLVRTQYYFMKAFLDCCGSNSTRPTRLEVINYIRLYQPNNPYFLRVINYFSQKLDDLSTLKDLYDNNPSQSVLEFMKANSVSVTAIINNLNNKVSAGQFATLDPQTFIDQIQYLKLYNKKSIDYFVELKDKYSISNAVLNAVFFQHKTNIVRLIDLIFTLNNLETFITNQFQNMFNYATTTRTNNTAVVITSLVDIIMVSSGTNNNIVSFLAAFYDNRQALFALFDTFLSADTFTSIQRRKRAQIKTLINTLLTSAGLNTMTPSNFENSFSVIDQFLLISSYIDAKDKYSLKPVYANFVIQNVGFFTQLISNLKTSSADILPVISQNLYSYFKKFRTCCGTNSVQPTTNLLKSFLRASPINQVSYIQLIFLLVQSSSQINQLQLSYYNSLSFQQFVSTNKGILLSILSQSLAFFDINSFDLLAMNGLITILNSYNDRYIGYVLDLAFAKNLDHSIINYILFTNVEPICTLIQRYGSSSSTSSFVTGQINNIVDQVQSGKVFINTTQITAGVMWRRLALLNANYPYTINMGQSLFSTYTRLQNYMRAKTSTIEFFVPVSSSRRSDLLAMINVLNNKFSIPTISSLVLTNIQTIISNFYNSIPVFEPIRVYEFILEKQVSIPHYNFVVDNINTILNFAISYRNSQSFITFYKKELMNFNALLSRCCTLNYNPPTMSTLWNLMRNAKNFPEILYLLEYIYKNGQLSVQLNKKYFGQTSFVSFLSNNKADIIKFIQNFQTIYNYKKNFIASHMEQIISITQKFRPAFVSQSLQMIIDYEISNEIINFFLKKKFEDVFRIIQDFVATNNTIIFVSNNIDLISNLVNADESRVYSQPYTTEVLINTIGQVITVGNFDAIFNYITNNYTGFRSTMTTYTSFLTFFSNSNTALLRYYNLLMQAGQLRILSSISFSTVINTIRNYYNQLTRVLPINILYFIQKNQLPSKHVNYFIKSIPSINKLLTRFKELNIKFQDLSMDILHQVYKLTFLCCGTNQTKLALVQVTNLYRVSTSNNDYFQKFIFFLYTNRQSLSDLYSIYSSSSSFAVFLDEQKVPMITLVNLFLSTYDRSLIQQGPYNQFTDFYSQYKYQQTQNLLIFIGLYNVNVTFINYVIFTDNLDLIVEVFEAFLSASQLLNFVQQKIQTVYSVNDNFLPNKIPYMMKQFVGVVNTLCTKDAVCRLFRLTDSLLAKLNNLMINFKDYKSFFVSDNQLLKDFLNDICDFYGKSRFSGSDINSAFDFTRNYLDYFNINVLQFLINKYRLNSQVVSHFVAKANTYIQLFSQFQSASNTYSLALSQIGQITDLIISYKQSNGVAFTTQQLTSLVNNFKSTNLLLACAQFVLRKPGRLAQSVAAYYSSQGFLLYARGAQDYLMGIINKGNRVINRAEWSTSEYYQVMKKGYNYFNNLTVINLRTLFATYQVRPALISTVFSKTTQLINLIKLFPTLSLTSFFLSSSAQLLSQIQLYNQLLSTATNPTDQECQSFLASLTTSDSIIVYKLLYLRSNEIKTLVDRYYSSASLDAFVDDISNQALFTNLINVIYNSLGAPLRAVTSLVGGAQAVKFKQYCLGLSPLRLLDLIAKQKIPNEIINSMITYAADLIRISLNFEQSQNYFQFFAATSYYVDTLYSKITNNIITLRVYIYSRPEIAQFIAKLTNAYAINTYKWFLDNYVIFKSGLDTYKAYPSLQAFLLAQPQTAKVTYDSLMGQLKRSLLSDEDISKTITSLDRLEWFSTQMLLQFTTQTINFIDASSAIIISEICQALSNVDLGLIDIYFLNRIQNLYSLEGKYRIFTPVTTPPDHISIVNALKSSPCVKLRNVLRFLTAFSGQCNALLGTFRGSSSHISFIKTQQTAFLQLINKFLEFMNVGSASSIQYQNVVGIYQSYKISVSALRIANILTFYLVPNKYSTFVSFNQKRSVQLANQYVNMPSYFQFIYNYISDLEALSIKFVASESYQITRQDINSFNSQLEAGSYKIVLYCLNNPIALGELVKEYESSSSLTSFLQLKRNSIIIFINGFNSANGIQLVTADSYNTFLNLVQSYLLKATFQNLNFFIDKYEVQSSVVNQAILHLDSYQAFVQSFYKSENKEDFLISNLRFLVQEVNLFRLKKNSLKITLADLNNFFKNSQRLNSGHNILIKIMANGDIIKTLSGFYNSYSYDNFLKVFKNQILNYFNAIVQLQLPTRRALLAILSSQYDAIVNSLILYVNQNPISCLTFSGSPKKCQVCNIGFAFVNNVCRFKCELSFCEYCPDLVPFSCKSCMSETYLTTLNTCFPCLKNCKACVDQKTCVVCVQKYFLYLDSQCVQKCEQKQNYFGFQKVCHKCNDDCPKEIYIIVQDIKQNATNIVLDAGFKGQFSNLIIQKLNPKAFQLRVQPMAGRGQIILPALSAKFQGSKMEFVFENFKKGDQIGKYLAKLQISQDFKSYFASNVSVQAQINRPITFVSSDLYSSGLLQQTCLQQQAKAKAVLVLALLVVFVSCFFGHSNYTLLLSLQLCFMIYLFEEEFDLFQSCYLGQFRYLFLNGKQQNIKVNPLWKLGNFNQQFGSSLVSVSCKNSFFFMLALMLAVQILRIFKLKFPKIRNPSRPIQLSTESELYMVNLLKYEQLFNAGLLRLIYLGIGLARNQLLVMIMAYLVFSDKYQVYSSIITALGLLLYLLWLYYSFRFYQIDVSDRKLRQSVEEYMTRKRKGINQYVPTTRDKIPVIAQSLFLLSLTGILFLTTLNSKIYVILALILREILLDLSKSDRKVIFIAWIVNSLINVVLVVVVALKQPNEITIAMMALSMVSHIAVVVIQELLIKKQNSSNQTGDLQPNKYDQQKKSDSNEPQKINQIIKDFLESQQPPLTAHRLQPESQKQLPEPEQTIRPSQVSKRKKRLRD